MKMYKLSEVPSEFQSKIVKDFKAQSYDRIWEFKYDVDRQTVYACSAEGCLELIRKRNSSITGTSLSDETCQKFLKSGL